MTIAALGGGTGLPAVLRALRRHLPASEQITAIVTAADDGGSSGVLRREYGVLPPGDIRNCLLALARVAPEISAALQYRFDNGVNLHPVGNLLLAALDMVATDEVAAIRLAAELLGVSDQILPSTTQRVHLVADLVDGRCVHGESQISRSGASIKRLRLDPADATAGPRVLEALADADAVVLGPGSLYTSLLAILIVPGVTDAIMRSSAVRIFVCNAMTEPGETDGYGLAEHLRALETHGLPPDAFDYVVTHTTPIPSSVLARYAERGAKPVDQHFAIEGSPTVVRADLLEAGPVIRHAPDKLGPILCDLALRRRGVAEARAVSRPGIPPVEAPLAAEGVA
jgi:uncharacterized cofD-like protein